MQTGASHPAFPTPFAATHRRILLLVSHGRPTPTSASGRGGSASGRGGGASASSAPPPLSAGAAMLWCGGASGAARRGPASSRSSPPAAALPGGFSVPAPLPRPSPPRWARCPARRSRTERRRGGLRRCRPALPLRSPLETHRRGARPGVPERAGFSEETAAQPARRYCGLGRGEGRLAFRVSAAAGAQRRLQASLARPASYSAAFDVRKQTPQSVRL